MPVFLRGWKRSTDCHLRELTAVGKLMDMHAFPPFMMLSIHHFLKRSTKRNVTPSLLRSIPLPNFSVVVFLYRILLLSMMQCDIHFYLVLPFIFIDISYQRLFHSSLLPPAWNIKKTPKNNSLLFDAISVFSGWCLNQSFGSQNRLLRCIPHKPFINLGPFRDEIFYSGYSRMK